jgi:ribonuclease BN (tRNA processing enzyme)
MIEWIGRRVVISADISKVDEVTRATEEVQQLLHTAFVATKQTGAFVTLAEILIDAVIFPIALSDHSIIEGLNEIWDRYDVSMRIA